MRNIIIAAATVAILTTGCSTSNGRFMEEAASIAAEAIDETSTAALAAAGSAGARLGTGVAS